MILIWQTRQPKIGMTCSNWFSKHFVLWGGGVFSIFHLPFLWFLCHSLPHFWIYYIFSLLNIEWKLVRKKCKVYHPSKASFSSNPCFVANVLSLPSSAGIATFPSDTCFLTNLILVPSSSGRTSTLTVLPW